MRFQTASRTDVGRVRKRNEDSLGSFTPADPAILKRYGICLAVADGVGGEAHGDVASKTAIATLLEDYYQGPAEVPVQQRLKDCVAKANTAVLKASEELRSRGMATTLVTAVVLDDRAVIANVGDSRAYVVNGPKATIRQISLDHSLVQEQVRMGILTPEEAEHAPNSNVITRALGTDAMVKVDVFEVPMNPGDTVLLCSDGLVRVVRDAEIAQILASNPLATAVDKLVALANSRGGPDNISICAAGTAGKVASKALPLALAATVLVLAGAALVLGRGQIGKLIYSIRQSTMVTLTVTSTPQDASIFLNGEDTTKVTPWTFTVKPGTYLVYLTLKDYKPYTEEVKNLRAGTSGEVSANLALSGVAVKTSTLTVRSRPPGAQVYLDTRLIGTTPCTYTATTTGPRTLRIILDDYQEYRETLNLEPGSEESVTATLTEIPEPTQKATLTVTSTPTGAQATLDGYGIGTTPIEKRFTSAGLQRKLILKLDGYEDYVKKIDLKAGDAKIVDGQLTKKATLTVTSTPTGAQATLDDYDIGMTPIEKRFTSAGLQRVLILKLDGYEDYVKKIDLKAGKAKVVDVRLVEKATLTVTSTPPGAKATLDDYDIGMTPIEKRLVNAGLQRELILKLDGYEDYVKKIDLKAGSEESVTATLTEIPEPTQKATLTVECTHGSAHVYLDGKDTGKNTRCTLEVTPGAHTIGFTLDDYQVLEVSVEVTEGEAKTVTCGEHRGESESDSAVTAYDTTLPGLHACAGGVDGARIALLGALSRLASCSVATPPQCYFDWSSSIARRACVVPTSNLSASWRNADSGSSDKDAAPPVAWNGSSRLASFMHGLFGVETASAGSGFSFDRTVSLVDQEWTASSVGLPIDVRIRFYGEIALSADCGIAVTSGSTTISQGDVRDCTAAIDSFPVTASLTIGVEVNGRDISKTVSASQSSPFGGELQFPAVNLTYPMLGNPTLTIYPNLSIGDSSLNMSVVTDGPLSVTPKALEFVDMGDQSFAVSSVGQGDSSVAFGDAALTLDADALVLGGELSVEIPLLGTQSVSIGTVTLPFAVQAQLDGSPAELMVATFSTTVTPPSPGGGTTPPNPSGTGSDKQGLGLSRPLIAVLAVGLVSVASLAGVLATRSGTASSPTSAMFLSLASGVVQLKPAEGMVGLGRGSENRVQLSDAKVSRRHASVYFASGCWWIEDTGSTNGTRVNGTKISGAVALNEGDVIEVGAERIIVGKSP